MTEKQERRLKKTMGILKSYVPDQYIYYSQVMKELCEKYEKVYNPVSPPCIELMFAIVQDTECSIEQRERYLWDIAAYYDLSGRETVLSDFFRAIRQW